MSYEKIAASDIMAPTKQGVLYRWTTGVIDKWALGYFVLKDDLVICYKKEQDTAPQEVLSLRGAVVMELAVGSEDSYELAAALEMDVEILRAAPKGVGSCFIVQVAGEQRRIDHWFAAADEEEGHEWVALIKRSLRAPGQVVAGSNSGDGGAMGSFGNSSNNNSSANNNGSGGDGFSRNGNCGGSGGGGSGSEGVVVRIFVPGGFCCERCESKIEQCIGTVSPKGLEHELDREHSYIVIKNCRDDTPDRIVEELLDNGIFANVVTAYTTD